MFCGEFSLTAAAHCGGDGSKDAKSRCREGGADRASLSSHADQEERLGEIELHDQLSGVQVRLERGGQGGKHGGAPVQNGGRTGE